MEDLNFFQMEDDLILLLMEQWSMDNNLNILVNKWEPQQIKQATWNYTKFKQWFYYFIVLIFFYFYFCHIPTHPSTSIT